MFAFVFKSGNKCPLGLRIYLVIEDSGEEGWGKAVGGIEVECQDWRDGKFKSLNQDVSKSTIFQEMVQNSFVSG